MPRRTKFEPISIAQIFISVVREVISEFESQIEKILFVLLGLKEILVFLSVFKKLFVIGFFFFDFFNGAQTADDFNQLIDDYGGENYD